MAQHCFHNHEHDTHAEAQLCMEISNALLAASPLAGDIIAIECIRCGAPDGSILRRAFDPPTAWTFQMPCTKCFTRADYPTMPTRWLDVAGNRVDGPEGINMTALCLQPPAPRAKAAA